MKEEKCECNKEEMMERCSCHHHSHHYGGKGTEALYGLGVIGALFYFLQHAVGFGPVIVGIFKAFFWPAFVIFKVLGILGI